jgi:hypothetical protein
MNINYFPPADLSEPPSKEAMERLTCNLFPSRTKFTFRMRDCWGDDFNFMVVAYSYEEAKSKANYLCDDATVDHLIKKEPENETVL